MPVGDFTAALTERVDYAVFVAYETWARETAYTAHNPYDVLARLLDGLPQALSTAMAERGGWVTLDPAGGLPNGESRMLINEMAAQVMVARIQAEAADVPDIGLLTGLIVDAVSGAITLFIEQPGSFDLARAEEANNAPLGSRTRPDVATLPSTVSDGQPEPEELAALPEAPEVAPVTTETEEAAAAPATADGWLAGFRQAFMRSTLDAKVMQADGHFVQDLSVLDSFWESVWAEFETALADSLTVMPSDISTEADPLVPETTGVRVVTKAEWDQEYYRLKAVWMEPFQAGSVDSQDPSGAPVELPATEAFKLFEPIIDLMVTSYLSSFLTYG